MVELIDIYKNPKDFMEWIDTQSKFYLYLISGLLLAAFNYLYLIGTNQLTFLQPSIISALLVIGGLFIAFIFPIVMVIFTYLGALILGHNNFMKVMPVSLASLSALQVYNIVASIFGVFLGGPIGIAFSMIIYFLGFVHSYALEIIGLKYNLNMSWVKAVIAPFIVPFILTIVVLGFFAWLFLGAMNAGF